MEAFHFTHWKNIIFIFNDNNHHCWIE